MSPIGKRSARPAHICVCEHSAVQGLVRGREGPRERRMGRNMYGREPCAQVTWRRGAAAPRTPEMQSMGSAMQVFKILCGGGMDAGCMLHAGRGDEADTWPPHHPENHIGLADACALELCSPLRWRVRH